MRQLFKIDESEKRRILEMHESAVRKNYLGEAETPAAATATPTDNKTPQQREPFTSASGVKYNLPAIQSEENITTFRDPAKYDAYFRFDKISGLPEGKNHIGFYVIALLDLIAQKATENKQVCNKEIGSLIDDAMMSAAYEQYKKRVSNLGIDPLPSGNMFKYACGSPNSQDMTTEEKVKWATTS